MRCFFHGFVPFLVLEEDGKALLRRFRIRGGGSSVICCFRPKRGQFPALRCRELWQELRNIGAVRPEPFSALRTGGCRGRRFRTSPAPYFLRLGSMVSIAPAKEAHRRTNMAAFAASVRCLRRLSLSASSR